jgi:hypothetical protein
MFLTTEPFTRGGIILPIYEYQCVDCEGRDQRVAGLDDHTALCAQCGGLMLRLDEDVFQPYFEDLAEPAWPGTKVKTTL